jgi:hypothetical protein
MLLGIQSLLFTLLVVDQYIVIGRHGRMLDQIVTNLLHGLHIVSMRQMASMQRRIVCEGHHTIL